MRFLCLDIGERRIGVACGDSRIGMATPVTTIHRRSWQQDSAAVRRLFAEQHAEALIVGLPVSLDGTLHFQGKRIKQEGERFGSALGMPVTFWDESFSTVIAEERLRTSPTAEHRKAPLDAAAAAVILESFFAAQQDSGGSPCTEKCR